MEFVVKPDGTLSECSIRDLAQWYSQGGEDVADFEAHLLLLKAYSTLVSSAQRGRRTLLGIERFGLLRVLYRHPARQMQMTELGRALDVSPTSITKLVTRLAKLGLVDRIPHESDKRRAWVRLTEAGEELMGRSLPNVREATRERWQGLDTEEKRTLAHLLTKFIQANCDDSLGQTETPD